MQSTLIDECVALLKANHNLILTGAPGTGKTWLAREIARRISSPCPSATDKADELTDQEIFTILQSSTQINSIEGEDTYTIQGVNGNRIFFGGDNVGDRSCTFNAVRKAYKQKLWQGGQQRNQSEPYTPAIAKYLYEHRHLLATEADGAASAIQFVQFHPSYDYTDFVEGLRPIPGTVRGEIGFERKDGIFKTFCKQALRHNPVSLFDEIFGQLTTDIANGRIQTLPLKSGNASATLSLSVNGCIKWSRSSDDETDANCVSKDRLFKLFRRYDTKEKLEAIPHIDHAIRDVIGGCNSTYYWAVLHHVLTQMEPRSKSFVFLIDEINRGELSKIFGELFFSLDPGYRGTAGRTQTQYQNLITDPDDPFREGFYVPENVYLVGTMNDIDRSVESMDFAMRRRFAWKEIEAASSTGMLDSLGSRKDEAVARMNRLNQAIWDERTQTGVEGLGSAYHIGGAYFKKLELYLPENGTDAPTDVEAAYRKLWDNHLEGLLYEYLRGMPDARHTLQQLKEAYEGSADRQQP